MQIDMDNEPPQRGFGQKKYDFDKLDIGDAFVIPVIAGRPKMASVKTTCWRAGLAYWPRRHFRHARHETGGIMVWRSHDYPMDDLDHDIPRRSDAAPAPFTLGIWPSGF